VLALLAGGAIGPGRLDQVGGPALGTGLLLGGEVLVGVVCGITVGTRVGRSIRRFKAWTGVGE
jgi:hypothetical protein